MGTAIFLEHNNRRYLLTARHVVHDEDKSIYNAKNDPRKLDPSYFDNTIVSQIFRVLSLDEMRSLLQFYIDKLKDDPNYYPSDVPESLFIMTAGSAELRPYTFNKELDLALISLDRDDVNVTKNFANETGNFADELIKNGSIWLEKYTKG